MWPLTLLYASSYGIVVPVVSTLAFCFVSFNVFKWMVSDTSIILSEYNNRHTWKNIRVTAKAWYCSICESLLVSGFGVYCDCCGVCADQECIRKADRKLTCKVTTLPVQKTMSHHWIKGNLPLGALCYICNDDCSMETGLVDYQCCWCQRCVHTVCRDIHTESCDLGLYKRLIIPPWCVQAYRRKSSVRRKLQVKTVTDPKWKNWTPLIVIGNCKSGNGDSALVLSEFRRLLNPAQVFDLAEVTPESALQWCHLVKPREIKLLIAGGDGTIAWMLNTIYRMELTKEPGIAIVPLGTGNDLSRVLGWGSEYTSDNIENISELMMKLMTAESRNFDRWNIEILPRSTFRLHMPVKHLFMYNYLSVGVDAQVALDFHRTRESRLYLFSNRIFNKLLYLCFGTHQVVAAGCRNLEKRLELYLDGELMELPEIEAIVVLNISSWGAGVNLWGMVSSGVNDKQSYNDGKLEVVGIYSSFHMAQLQVGLATPHRIGQATKVQINLLTASPVQIDGEPWEQFPGQIVISATQQAKVLVNNDQSNR